MLAISVTILEMFTVQKWTKINVNLLIDSPQATFYLLAIAMFVLSVTVCEILTVEMCMTLTLTFRIYQGKIYIC